MGDIYKDVYSASKNCINTQFCADGGSFDSSSLEMPRSLKIRIVANPDFWGFGSLSDNTLIEGWGTFNEGFFDFFDGYDPDHSSLKTCGETTTGPYTNEQRPDVSYRSVYDPENGDTHYAGGSEDGVIRGGAEAYLLDRAAEQTGDGSSCDNTDPVSVFKTNPAGYGSYPKILFNSKIYKNVTGAWRIEECDICYDDVSTNALRVYDCSGAPKQNINADGNFATLYDPFQERCTLPEFAGESGCQPDGTVASQYSGSGTTIIRETSLSPFLEFTLHYNNSAASGLFNGQALGIDSSANQDGVITIFDVAHQSSTTTFKSVGSVGATNYSDSGGFAWTAFNTYDPNTCCGGAAYGVDYDSKRLTNSTSYHIDIGRVFNNPKNVYYSNRLDRSYNGFSVDRAVEDGTFRRDYSYVAVNEDGNALLVASGAVHEVDLACSTGVWDATATHIYELDGTYSTSSGVGSTALSTESGFYPLFPKELPYFGSFMDVDRWDNAVRSLDDGTREVNRNTTCYTKTGSLAVYPDCLSQWTSYTSCDPKNKYTLNNVPRISLVYRGCDYNDPCTFDDSGRPWTAGASGHPSNMEDLIRGFGGQEIQMYINLGTARAAEIKRDPCCCPPAKCPGTSPPTFVEVESPVTFPCFPKFDLRPSDYGCQDPLYFIDVMTRLGLDTDPIGGCADPTYDACTPKQPYTTYGYIRNLCGKETNSRREVIDSLSTKLHTGDYQDITFSNNTVEPMYVAFEQDTPNCCSPSGFPTGSTECDPGLMTPVFAGYGATAELVIDATGGFTYNILSTGTGYVFGGAVVNPVAGLSPEQTFTTTFGAPGDGLSSITSTPGSGSPFNTTIPLTIFAGGGGIAGTGGFSYNACNTEGTVHYWGLTDFQGRLALPYFNTKANTTTICGNTAGSYVDYDSTGTLANDWPKDKVPFLVEIDHEDNCTSCSVTQMEPKDLVLTVTSLKTEFAHNQTSVNGGGKIYGWNHCAYPGLAITPSYDIPTDSWTGVYCVSGDGFAQAFGSPYVGETCECADGASFTMKARVLEGTSTPIGYLTYNSENPNNSYLPFGTCGEQFFGLPPSIINALSQNATDVMSEHTVYMKASISCSPQLFQSPWTTPGFGGDDLSDIYGCNGGCATSFPSPNSSPSLDLDFFFVRDQYKHEFEKMDDTAIFNNVDWLSNGLTVSSSPGGTGVINITTNIQGCEGARLLLYGCSPYSGVKTFSGGGFLGAGGGLGGSGDINSCSKVGWVGASSMLSEGDLKPDARNAIESYWLPHPSSGDFGQAGADLTWGCTNPDSTRCCYEYEGAGNKPKDRDWKTSAACFCDGTSNKIVAYEATYTLAGGWQTNSSFPGVPLLTHWSGENIPGIGNIGILPVGEPIAIKYNDASELTLLVENETDSISTEPACAYHTGPNRYTYIGAELTEPFRPTSLLDGPPNLQPESCTNPIGSSNDFYGTCGRPVPFSTYAGGIGTGIRVNKKSCWPEVMTVHKIDCVSSGYKLHVSREYFEHDQKWYHLAPGPAGATVVTRLGLIKGGENSSRYSCEDTYLDCLDPRTGVSPTVLDYSFALNMMTPTDTVFPVYPDLCATGADPVFLTTSSAINGTTDSTYSTGCLLYPSISGQQFYSYYNAFYDTSDPSAIFLSDAGGGSYQIPPDPEADCNESYPHNLANIAGNADPLFTSLASMRSSHSCLQDLSECGGELWCNKEFFPRRSYLKNTRITRFAALSLCTQNSQLQAPNWYEGHETTWDDSPNKEELSTGTFIDACDDDSVVLLDSEIDIDDNVILIPFNNSTGTSSSILTLMGLIHPGFKSNVNEKTCIYASSGECLTFLPEHSDRSIRDITFTADDYGYYLDKLVASGSHDCLFIPFKIMMDVECCADRIGHRGTSDPTNLNYIAKVPASVCNGWISDPNCLCVGDTQPWDTCQRYDTDHLLPGLTCLTFQRIHPVTDVGDCYVECASSESGYNALTQETIRSLPTPLDYGLLDPYSNDPNRFLTLVASNAVITSHTGCLNECSISLYDPLGESPIPTGSIDYNYATVTSRDDIYSYNGKEYIKSSTEQMDVFIYKGDYYRICGNDMATDTNCCANEGCGCDWNVCQDYPQSIQIMSSGIDPGGLLLQTTVISAESCPTETYPSGNATIDYTDFLKELGCNSYSNIHRCSYESYVNFNITESI